MGKRAHIPAAQIHDLFPRPMQSRHESLTIRVDNAFRALDELEKERRELRREAFEEKQAQLRAEHLAKCEPLMAEITELWEDAKAQLSFAYEPENLRQRQALELTPAEASALRSELRDATSVWLLRRAQRAHAEDDVATAVTLEEEIARRNESGKALDSAIVSQIHEATSATTNEALRTDLAARELLLKTAHMAEASKLKFGELTGQTKAIDRIRYGVRVHQDLVERATPTRRSDLRPPTDLAEEDQQEA